MYNNKKLNKIKMSAATEQQNNGDVAVEKVADAVDAAAELKEDLKSAKPAVEEKKSAAADNGTASKEDDDDVVETAAPKGTPVKATKRPADVSF